jgi:phosphomannomutase
VTADSLHDRVQRWIESDPDPLTRAELIDLLERSEDGFPGAEAALRERFAGPLVFGTAGLRGLLGGGESRMNRAVVLRTTYGLGQHLLEQVPDLVRNNGVVIGYDGRRLGRVLAEDTAAVFAALGIPSSVTPRPCPTPLTAFAVTDQRAAAGIMVTASHNPPEYNGYKVYWGNGAQIIPPHDARIAAAIDRAPPAREVPRADLEDARRRGQIKPWSDDLERRYLDAVASLSVRSDGDRSFPIVYTPLHGTGDRLTRKALAEAGFTNVTTVPEQAEPDGAFPTLAFPNPEEPGALDLAQDLAGKLGAPLILANDPDVDRLAAAVLDESGRYVQLTGNQLGVLLGHYLLTEGKDKDKNDRLVIATLVSSPMLGSIARALGVRYEETLTGFKWITNRAIERERTEGLRFVFAFEEALGYTVGSIVRDKDGIGAAVVLAELAAVRYAQKKTLLDEIETISRRYGLFVSGQRAVTLPGAGGLARIEGIMRDLRASQHHAIGGMKIVATADYEACERATASGDVTKTTLPRSNVLAFELEGQSRIIVRPSGTEPKLKFYFDLCEPMEPGEPFGRAEDRAKRRMNALARAMLAIAGV